MSGTSGKTEAVIGGMTYLGHPPNYWLELERRAEKLGVSDLLQEIANLRAKVSFYESRFKEMESFRQMMETVEKG